MLAKEVIHIIQDIQKKNPSLNDEFLKKNWAKTFNKAKKEAEDEMKKKLIGVILLILFH